MANHYYESPQILVSVAIVLLSFKQILCYQQSHGAGSGSIYKHLYAYRKLLASMAEKADEEKYLAKAVWLRSVDKMVQLCSHGSFVEDPLTMPQQILSFCLGATCNIQHTAISF